MGEWGSLGGVLVCGLEELLGFKIGYRNSVGSGFLHTIFDVRNVGLKSEQLTSAKHIPGRG